MESNQRFLTLEEMRQKTYREFFAAGENLINVGLAQMPEDQRMAIMGAVAAGHSELELFIRYGQPGGEKTGDALIALRTGEKVTALARIEARPGKPPAIRVN